MPTTKTITAGQLESWNTLGYFRIPAFEPKATCNAMLERVIAIARDNKAGKATPNVFIMNEQQDMGTRTNPEEYVSKIFRLHRDPVFRDFAMSTRVTDIVADLIAPDIDCFLSQFIFKNPGAWGQPWHQDSYYFPFEPARPVVGIWLAVTKATLENGCLHVLAGSHTEPIHEHVPDRRPSANYGYVEIVDNDMSAAEPVLMEAGDLLVFDSHLMHRSTDNVSAGIRAAMVYHYAAAGTVETKPVVVNDWVPARRG